MILNSTQVEQAIDGDRYGTFIKEIVLARPEGPNGQRFDVPLAILRKRSVAVAEPKASLLLIHGYGQNRYAWHLPARSFGNYLADEGFDVFMIDLRGHGRSRHLGARPPKDLNDYVREDAPAAIREVQQISQRGPIYLIGHSLGGLISYAVTPAMREAVAGIVTLGSPYHFTRGSRFLKLFGTAMMALEKQLPWAADVALPLQNVGEVMSLARGFVESSIFPLPVRGYAPKSMERRVLSQHMALAMDRGSIAVMHNMFLRAAEGHATGHRLGTMYGYAAAFEKLRDIPLLIIAGSEDDLAPPDSVRPAYELSCSSDKTYRVFPRGHIDIIIGRDAPLTIWPLILAWLNTRVRRSPVAAPKLPETPASGAAPTAPQQG